MTKALEIRRQRLDEGHPNVARTKRHLASLLIARGSLETAGTLLSEASAVFRDSLGKGDWEVVATQSVQGAYLAELGRYEEAESLLVESYPFIKRIKGEGSIYERDARRRIVELYEAWGKPEKAKAYRAMPNRS